MIHRRSFLQSSIAVPFGTAFLLPGCNPAEQSRLKIKLIDNDALVLYGRILDSDIHIEVFDEDIEFSRSALIRARALLEEMDGTFSLAKVSSQVRQLNEYRQLASPSDYLTALNTYVREMKIATGGAFNVAATPLSNSLMKGDDRDAEFIADAMKGFDGHAFLDSSGVMKFTNERTIIGFEPCLSGFAADLIHAQMQGVNLNSAFIDTGQIRTIGLSANKLPFTIDLGLSQEEPLVSGTAAKVQASTIKGRDGLFVFDPREGLKPAEYESLSIIADSTLAAECLARAFILMPQDEITRRKNAATAFGLTQRCDVIVKPIGGGAVRL